MVRYKRFIKCRLIWGGLLLGLTPMLLAGCVSADDPSAIDAGRPPTPRTYYALARVLKDRGDANQAIVIYSRLAKNNPTFAPAYNELAELLVNQHQYAQACMVLQKGLENLPGDPVLLNNLGLAHLRAREWAPATDAFKQAVKARPGESRYQSNLALALGMQGRLDEASSIYKKILPGDQVQRQLAAIREARNDDASSSATISIRAEGKNGSVEVKKSGNEGAALPRPALPGG